MDIMPAMSWEYEIPRLREALLIRVILPDASPPISISWLILPFRVSLNFDVKGSKLADILNPRYSPISVGSLNAFISLHIAMIAAPASFLSS